MIGKEGEDGRHCHFAWLHFPFDENSKQLTLCPVSSEEKSQCMQLVLTKPSKTLTYVCVYIYSFIQKV